MVKLFLICPVHFAEKDVENNHESILVVHDNLGVPKFTDYLVKTTRSTLRSLPIKS